MTQNNNGWRDRFEEYSENYWTGRGESRGILEFIEQEIKQAKIEVLEAIISETVNRKDATRFWLEEKLKELKNGKN